MRRKRTWVSKYGRASKGAFEYADGREHEARAYFHERHLWRPIGLQRVLFDYLPKKKRRHDSRVFKQKNVVPDLKVAEPDLGVEDGEREDVVNERLSSPSLGRHAKYLREEKQRKHK